jgi:hypothetical protein
MQQSGKHASADIETGERFVGDTQLSPVRSAIKPPRPALCASIAVTAVSAGNLWSIRLSTPLPVLLGALALGLSLTTTLLCGGNGPEKQTSPSFAARSYALHGACGAALLLLALSRAGEHRAFPVETVTTIGELSAAKRSEGVPFPYFGLEKEMERAANMTSQHYRKIFPSSHSGRLEDSSVVVGLQDASHLFWMRGNYLDKEQDAEMIRNEPDEYIPTEDMFDGENYVPAARQFNTGGNRIGPTAQTERASKPTT